MGAFRSTRRAFLTVVSAAFLVVAIPFRRWVSRGDKLVGEWTVAEYVCDGKPVLTIAQHVRVAMTHDTMTVWLQLPDMTEHTQSCRYTVNSSTDIDIRNSDDTATFEGVYHLDQDCLTLSWDTIGKGRPTTTTEAGRFGLNRMSLRRT